MKADDKHEFSILKSDELIIGGYASIEIVDKQNDLITIEALRDSVKKYMKEQKYRNVMSNHSNVQVGEVIDKYRDSNGVVHKTDVDDVGFYVVIKLRDDIEKAKEISRGIRKGTLRSFSIGGQAISKKERTSDEYGKYNEIDELELHEVTICEKGINPEAKFDILKMEEKTMSEQLEKSLEELNDLLKQVQEFQKGDESLDEETKNESEDESDLETVAASDEAYMDTEETDDKVEMALDEDSTRDYQAGEEVVSGGKPTGTPSELKVAMAKGLTAEDFTSLNLSNENIEKAYEQYKAEQLEKMAMENLSTHFGERFAEELAVKKSDAEKAEYDARGEVAALKEEFSELRKSLSEKDDEIRKTQEISMEIPEGFPTTTEQLADMSWSDIHSLARGN
tara:strand:- start:13391 stop:14575 length:1185 start_codon:yes stop_codon:yes gene_type:complete